MENQDELYVKASDPRDFHCERAISLDQAMEEEDEIGDSLADSMICDTGSLLIPNGSTNPVSKEEIVLFLNAGAMASRESASGVCVVADKYFDGGDTFQTEDFITENGDYTCVYQSARMGNFLYDIEDIPPGDYLIDLHFAEIININGPKGMRVFNVFVQEEKVLSNFDIFSMVGSNKPLQLVGARVSVKDDGLLSLRFEGVHGSPTVSGICIRKADKSSAPVASGEYFVCTNCSTEIEYPPAQKKALRAKSIAKYEKDIQGLKDTLRRKTEECHQSWMSWSAVNEELEKVRMQLDNKTFQTYSFEQTLDKQAEKFRLISNKYERDQKSWTTAMDNLEKKIKEMKQEHAELSREAHECVGSIPDLNQMVYAVQALVEQCEDLKVKYNDEQTMRRKFFNQVQEAKGNIRVFCRCRPLSAREVTGKCASIVNFDAAKDGELGVISNGSTKKTFKFDRVYSPNDDQVDVFTDAAPMVISVLDGYNVCIFAYGQTGTGKTFTMEGTETNRGVNYRTLEELFKIANERKETNSYGISVSVLEVYNEQIRDLLAIEASKKLEIKQAPEGSHHIPGVVEAKVDNIYEVWNVLHAGSSARAVGSNNVNEHSSRSHCILCIMVKAKNLLTGESTKSKLWLVDLAGSERLAKTDVQGERLKEAQNINRSLSALGDVISALANKSSHIPYRNSKLTHLLQDSLGGDSKTLMFVQISPSDQDVSETLSSLNFATRVRGVELGLARKQIDTSELQRLKAMLDKSKQECRSKDETVKKLEENLHNLDSKFKGKDQLCKSQLDKIRELESQLELKTSFHCQSQKEISQLSERLNGKEESCAWLQQKVNDLENKLRQQEEIQSAIYQKKVVDLEEKLREQMKESKSSSLVLQQKVKELEKELKEQDQNPEVLSLRQKVKEAEEKLKEQEHDAEILSLREKLKELEDKVRDQARQLECTMISEPINISRSTPIEKKQFVREDITNEAEHRILRSLNSANRRVSQGAAPVKENDSLHHEVVRKKRLSRSSDVENNSIGVPSPVRDNKHGPSDAPKPFSRLARPPTKPVAAQKPIVRTKTSRDPAPGVKERDTKKRMWSR